MTEYMGAVCCLPRSRKEKGEIKGISELTNRAELGSKGMDLSLVFVMFPVKVKQEETKSFCWDKARVHHVL